MTTACALTGLERSSAGQRSAWRCSQVATTGSEPSQMRPRLVAIRALPSLRCRRLNSNPTKARISKTEGGWKRLRRVALTWANSTRNSLLKLLHSLPDAGAPAQEQHRSQQHQIQPHGRPSAVGPPAELGQKVHPTLPGRA